MAKTKVQSDSSQSSEQANSSQTALVVPAKDTEILRQTETVVVFRVTKPMLKREYEELSARVRTENQASGLKIVLAPAIVDGVEISG